MEPEQKLTESCSRPAFTGIATHGLDLAHFLIGFFAPALGKILMFIAGPLYLIWFPMVGVRHYKLRRVKD